MRPRLISGDGRERRMMQRLAAPLLEAAGAVCVVVGSALVYEPAGWIVGGLALIVKAFEVDLRRVP